MMGRRHAAAFLCLLASCNGGETDPAPLPPTAPIPVATVTVEPAHPVIVEGTTVQLMAIPRDAQGTALEGRVIEWSSSRLNIATVSGTGLVTGILVGSSKVSATVEGRIGEVTVIVRMEPVADVTVTGPAVLQVGATAQFVVTLKDQYGNTLDPEDHVISWSSGNGAVASVTPTGMVTAAGAGAATITATSEGKSGHATVQVVAPTP